MPINLTITFKNLSKVFYSVQGDWLQVSPTNEFQPKLEVIHLKFPQF